MKQSVSSTYYMHMVDQAAYVINTIDSQSTDIHIKLT